MSVSLKDFPNIKANNYEEFILALSRKANLNRIYKAKIKWEWVKYFDEKEEKEIMELDSVKWLYNLI